MRQKSGLQASAEQHIKTIRRVTRKKYSTEENIWVVRPGLRGEYAVADLRPARGDRRESLLQLVERVPVSLNC